MYLTCWTHEHYGNVSRGDRKKYRELVVVLHVMFAVWTCVLDVTMDLHRSSLQAHTRFSFNLILEAMMMIPYATITNSPNGRLSGLLALISVGLAL